MTERAEAAVTPEPFAPSRGQALVRRARLFGHGKGRRAQPARAHRPLGACRTSSAASWCRWKRWSSSRTARSRSRERRFFPGYVLVEMEMDDDTWHLVKHTSKVTGFVGGAQDAPVADLRSRGAEDRHRRCRKASKSRARRCSGRWARWCASRKARSPTSTARSRTSTTTSRKVRVVGHDLRPRDAGRARLRAGREGLIQPTGDAAPPGVSRRSRSPGDWTRSRAGFVLQGA